MTQITLHPIAEAEVSELFRFELENRAFFERTIASFGDDYYERATLEKITEGRVRDWENGDAYFYLVRDAAGDLVGRISLFDVQRGATQTATIGYRIAEAHSGKGIATKAVARVLEDAFEVYGLHRIEGATSPANLGSQIVMLKNGFGFWGRSRRSYLLNGVWEDCVLLERLADERPPTLR